MAGEFLQDSLLTADDNHRSLDPTAGDQIKVDNSFVPESKLPIALFSFSFYFHAFHENRRIDRFKFFQDGAW